MPRKMARQYAGSRPSRVGTSRQSNKSLQFAPLPSSSEESRFIYSYTGCFPTAFSWSIFGPGLGAAREFGYSLWCECVATGG